MKYFLYVHVLFFLVTRSYAQDIQTLLNEYEELPRGIATSIVSSSQFPTLHSNLRADGNDIISASLAIEQEGAKMSFAPFLYLFDNYNDWLSETRFQIAKTDKGNAIGISFRKNPKSPYSKNGNNLFSKIPRDYGVFPLEKYLEYERKIKEAKEADNLPDLVRLKSEQEALVANYKEGPDKRRFALYEKLIFTSKPVLDASYNMTLFDVLGGSSVDADTNSFNDNEYRIRKHAISGSFTWGLYKDIQLAGLIGYEWERANADGESEFAEYVTAGLTLSRRLIVLDDNYKKSKDYRENLFIPSILLGLSWEGRYCQSEKASCIEELVDLSAFTVFIDFNLSSKSQFRIGVPYKLSRKVDASESSEITAITQISFQIGK